MPVINRGSSGGLPQGFVQMPIIVAPAEGAFILPDIVTLTGTPFGTVGIPDTLKAITVQLARDEAFTGIFHTQRIVTTSTTVTVTIPAQAQGSAAFARLVYEGDLLGESEPGTQRKLIVTTAVAPTVTNPVNGATGVGFSPTIELSPWTDTGDLDVGATTRVQLSAVQDFASILWDSGELSYRIDVAVGMQLSKGQVVYAKAWHTGKIIGKTPSSFTSKFTTKVRDNFSIEQQYITSGTYTFTVPNDVTKIRVLCIGAGASGAKGTNSFEGGLAGGAGGRGGGGGGMFSGVVNVIPGQVIPLIVGSTPSKPGRDGGASSFDTKKIVCEGGLGASIGGCAYASDVQVIMRRQGAPAYKSCKSYSDLSLDKWDYNPSFMNGDQTVLGGKGGHGYLNALGYGVGGIGGNGISTSASPNNDGAGDPGGIGGFGGGIGGRGGDGGLVYMFFGAGGRGGGGGDGGYSGGKGGNGAHGYSNTVNGTGNGGSGGYGGSGGLGGYGGDGGTGGDAGPSTSSGLGGYGGGGGRGGPGGSGGKGGNGGSGKYAGGGGNYGGNGGPGCIVIWY